MNVLVIKLIGIINTVCVHTCEEPVQYILLNCDLRHLFFNKDAILFYGFLQIEYPDSGTVLLHTKSGPSQFPSAGDEVIVSCQPGRILVEVGSPIVYALNRGVSTCQSDGTWSHRFNCVKKTND